MANPYTNHAAVDHDENPFANEERRAAPAAAPEPAYAAPQPAYAAPQADFSPVKAAAPSPPPAAANDMTFFDPSPQQAQAQAYSPPAGQAFDPNARAPAVDYPQANYPAASPPVVAQPSDQQQPDGAAPEQPPAIREMATHKVWTLDFYQQFFDVDTKDVLMRYGNVLLPFHPPDFLLNRNWHAGPSATLAGAAANFSGTEEKKPDMYGPFWVCTTLWVTIGIVGNLMSKLAHSKAVADHAGAKDKDGKPLPALADWSYDFEEASIACFTVYLFVVLMSLLIWGLMKWKAVPVGVTDVLCLYGYSMFLFELCAILCVVPSKTFQWFACVATGLWSMAYLLMNFWKLWRMSLDKCWFASVVTLVGIAQIGLALAMKLYFFNYDF